MPLARRGRHAQQENSRHVVPGVVPVAGAKDARINCEMKGSRKSTAHALGLGDLVLSSLKESSAFCPILESVVGALLSIVKICQVRGYILLPSFCLLSSLSVLQDAKSSKADMKRLGERAEKFIIHLEDLISDSTNIPDGLLSSIKEMTRYASDLATTF